MKNKNKILAVLISALVVLSLIVVINADVIREAVEELTNSEKVWVKHWSNMTDNWNQAKALDKLNLTTKERNKRLKEIYGDDFVVELP